jgi:membrane-bound metal-dependent hydrolase YbcI (DUF457 family)
VNTPSHYVLNLVLLGTTIAPNATVAITLGAILPDAPIFIFYGVSKWIYRLPEAQIWTEAYYQPVWQNIIAFSHSIPLAAIGALICWYWGWKSGLIFCISLIFHSLLDLPVHHDDAHRHFYPFSDYRFISPLSYWNPKYYGNIVALVELCLVAIATPGVWKLLKTPLSKGLLLGINLLYVFAYSRFYLR